MHLALSIPIQTPPSIRTLDVGGQVEVAGVKADFGVFGEGAAGGEAGVAEGVDVVFYGVCEVVEGGGNGAGGCEVGYGWGVGAPFFAGNVGD